MPDKKAVPLLGRGVRRALSLFLTAGPAGLLASLLVVAFNQPVPAVGPAVAVPERVPVAYQPTERYEMYAEILHASGVDDAALGKEWIASGRRALDNALPVALPFRETGWFDESRADAIGYRFVVPRGRRVEVAVELEADGPQRLFVDLFRLSDEVAEPPVHVATGAGEERRLELQVVDDGSYVLRVQPELLRGGRFTLTVRNVAALRFPVAGLDSRAIQSRYGVERDGGRRTHRGVDIFAPRGTPAVASADGEVVWVGELPLGGKVVWLELEGGHNLYYAHLERQAVSEGQRVRAGDVVGWVGNTGNARTTPPHLHFGVYLDVRDAVDPYPFIDHLVDAAPADVAVETAALGDWARPARDGVDLRGEAEGSALRSHLGQDVPFRLEGATGDRYRVRLPDDTVGYVSAASLAPIDATAAAAMRAAARR